MCVQEREKVCEVENTHHNPQYWMYSRSVEIPNAMNIPESIRNYVQLIE